MSVPPAQLSQINIYPIKSTRGMSVSRTWVSQQGLSQDRRLMVAKRDGTMLTARTCPQLLNVNALFIDGGLRLTYPGQASMTLLMDDCSRATLGTEVWGAHFEAWRTTLQADDWFSDIIGEPVFLLYAGQRPTRIHPEMQQALAFVDEYPALLISQGSLAGLNRRSQRINSMAQFRPNLVIANTEEFAEDGWRRIKIGEVIFAVEKACERCILTTIEPETGQFHALAEPLATLAQFRAEPAGGVFFGQNLRALNAGVLEVGDVVEVLETQAKATYVDNSIDNSIDKSTLNTASASFEVGAYKNVSITLNDTCIAANNQQTLLQHFSQQSVDINSGCRAGVCGACKVTLHAGEVMQTASRALSAEDVAAGNILACCSRAITDVVLTSVAMKGSSIS